jgi:dTDP-3-amino-3,6-dideoxy-alpha-D-glucopyranose N,N-dimethyltransferase/dTDP-3-amino-3,4,6-trideoxy-alpha-D-glucopyranose N,N-dimethyltransferase
MDSPAGDTLYGVSYVDIYDQLMRNRGKDYAGQAEEVARLVREQHPAASSLLDVACGTGLHLRFFAKLFDRVMGVDGSPDMLAFARTRLPDIQLRRADMREFRLSESFDVITCMFAVPHLRSVAELEKTVGCFADHLAPGGVLVIEPWFDPDRFAPGYVATDLIECPDRTIFRVSHSSHHDEDPARVRMVVHFVEADHGRGIRHATETIDMTLFNQEQYSAAFASNGCTADYVPGGRFPRGLWLARQAS